MIDSRERGSVRLTKKELGPKKKRGGRSQLTKEAVFATDNDGNISNEPVDWSNINPKRIQREERKKQGLINKEIDGSGGLERPKEVNKKEKSGKNGKNKPKYNMNRLKGQPENPEAILKYLERLVKEGNNLTWRQQRQYDDLKTNIRNSGGNNDNPSASIAV